MDWLDFQSLPWWAQMLETFIYWAVVIGVIRLVGRLT